MTEIHPTVNRKRLWANVDAEGDCWEWLGWRSTAGYGRYGSGGKYTAHRIVWELLVGEIPEGLTLDHLCANRGCVNPDHLEPVTHAENVRRGYRTKRATCRLGHMAYRTVPSSYRVKSGELRRSTMRVCVICIRENERKRYARNKGLLGGPQGSLF